MTIMKTIQERRSIRRHDSRDIPADSLQSIFKAVQCSQSWANSQCWELIVIRDQNVKKALQETIPSGNPSYQCIVTAPIVLALCGHLEKAGYYGGGPVTKFGDWFMFDLGIVTENICLTAHDLGLGTVVVGLFDHAKAAKVLSVPENYELAVLLPLGYPTDTPAPTPRRKIEDFLHEDRF
ncbi:MAG: nitroreductase family protein [Syntrophobacterales bacterium]|nr:nitroreductase family protein [Syntrophobacterales bacterium]